MNILFTVIAILSLGYYGVIVAYAGFQASFSLFWLALSIVCGFLAFLFSLKRFRIFLKGLPLWVKVPVRTTIALGLLCFVVVEALIVFPMFRSPDADLDYLIVLGAQVKGETVSNSLRLRLDEAVSYLEEHEDTRVIVTGGKGPGEDISEAAALRNYLVDKGIPESRIILERYASNTEENLSYSMSLIGNKEASVGIVTNDFHIFRSVSMARKLGMKHVTGLPAPSDGILKVNLTVREFFAVLKDKFLGNI